MSWLRVVIYYVVAFLGMWALHRVMPTFPHIAVRNIAVVAAAVALVAWGVTEMVGRHAAHWARGILAWISATAVLSVYFTTLPRFLGHPYAYFESAIALGVLIGLTELAAAPRAVHEAHANG